MKYMKRAKIYQASNYNVTFNPQTLEAHSYQYWKFVALVDGLVIFNNYYYSPSTRKHQCKVRALMNELGIKIDLVVQLQHGIKTTNLAELILEAEEIECDLYLKAMAKQDDRNEKAKARRKEKREAKIAEFKRNLDSITPADIDAFRAAKLTLVGGAE